MPPGQGSQVFCLDFVRRILDTDAVYIQVGFLVVGRTLQSIDSWRHDVA